MTHDTSRDTTDSDRAITGDCLTLTEIDVDLICRTVIFNADNIDAAVFALTRRGELDWQPIGVNLPKPATPTIRPEPPDFRTAAEKLNALGIEATRHVNHVHAGHHFEKLSGDQGVSLALEG